jgi:hypothetical protein
MLARMDRLVGREAELERIDRVLERLHSGPLRCLTVEGEPGIGKTRLLAELRRRSEDQGQLVLHGVASEFETYLPFGVVADAFDAYLASLRDYLAGGWPPQLRAELASMFPSLHDRPGLRLPARAQRHPPRAAQARRPRRGPRPRDRRPGRARSSDRA